MKKRTIFYILLISLLFTSCARGPFENDSGGITPAPTTRKYLSIYLYINEDGTLDTVNGAYMIFFDAENNEINIEQPETYTDYIIYQNGNFIWWHRQETDPGHYDWNPKGTVNDSSYVYKNVFRLRFDINDTSNFLNQWLPNDRFTMHIATLDNHTPSMRTLDTLGTGPDSIIGSTINTIYVSKTLGVDLNNQPSTYPNDAIDDCATDGRDYPPEYPVVNFDIKRFEIKPY